MREREVQRVHLTFCTFGEWFHKRCTLSLRPGRMNDALVHFTCHLDSSSRVSSTHTRKKTMHASTRSCTRNTHRDTLTCACTHIHARTHEYSISYLPHLPPSLHNSTNTPNAYIPQFRLVLDPRVVALAPSVNTPPHNLTQIHRILCFLSSLPHPIISENLSEKGIFKNAVRMARPDTLLVAWPGGGAGVLHCLFFGG